jgi:hypothetical protein
LKQLTLNNSANTLSTRSTNHLPQTSLPVEPASFLSPDRDEPHWEGWEFGQRIRRAELFAVIQKVTGVRHVLSVELFWLALRDTDIFKLNQLEKALEPPSADKRLRDEAIASFDKVRANTQNHTGIQSEKQFYVLWKPLTDENSPILPTTLLCSPLNHRVTAELL